MEFKQLAVNRQHRTLKELKHAGVFLFICITFYEATLPKAARQANLKEFKEEFKA